MNTIRPLVLSLALVLAQTTAARSIALPAASDQDLTPTTLTASPANLAKAARLETLPVQFAWVLPPEQTLQAQSPYAAESREFWMRVSAAELQSGKRVQTSAPEALFRLSPIGTSKSAIDPLQVEITSGMGTFARGNGLKNAANAAELKAANAPFPSGTLAFQLKADVGQGAMQIRVAKAAQDYLLHVYEPNSSQTLSLKTDRITAVHGQTFKVIAAANDGGAVEAIGGFLSAPNGLERALDFKREGNQYVATVAHDGLAGEGEGLWEIHTFSSQGGIQRDAKTVIVSSVPRARLGGNLESLTGKKGALSVSVSIDVAAASRYELRGVLQGFDGKTVRVGAVASSAASLKPGSQALTLVFDAETIAKSGLQAPFSVRDLTLTDQATLAVQETRQQAIAL
ncbi:hypothetical protein C7S18_07865 [Ahniella affigens]|uniref:DUF4785 domain-containing protein n=1 Tax=Ahniella affigens TaxID=2021234 RepID=A0A2P1PQK1_9GAMM|nr:DUF4785 domain-containing protein [Ahniella affigens]AVP97112.1 hypothetical protein C7S18_07865 [Ahniella affigens]